MNTINPIQINQKWEELNNTINKLEEIIPSLKIAYLSSFVRGIDNVSNNLGSVFGNMVKRQNLMDLQCFSKTFHGSFHEQYHDVCNHLETDLDNLFVSLKACLNRFASLIYELLSHEQKRGLKPKSYGTLLHSLNKMSYNIKELIEFKRIILEDGRQIDNEINDYRDEHIEHIREPGLTGLTSEPGILKKIHRIQNHNLQDNIVVEHGSGYSNEKHYDVARIVNEKGDYTYYVHIKVTSNNLYIKKGEQLGIPSDGGSGHFSKYEPHMHIFSSPNIKLTQDDISTNDIKSKYSPDPIKSSIFIVDYFQKVFKQILKMNKVLGNINKVSDTQGGDRHTFQS